MVDTDVGIALVIGHNQHNLGRVWGSTVTFQGMLVLAFQKDLESCHSSSLRKCACWSNAQGCKLYLWICAVGCR